MPEVFVFQLPSLADMEQFAAAMAGVLQPPITLAVDGPLGAGKTQFVRFLAKWMGVDEANVTSPTYVLMQSYRGTHRIHHFDFYRLDSAAQVWDLGIDELYEQPCVVVIEWAEKYPECLPADFLQVRITPENETRSAEVRAYGPRSQQQLCQFCSRFADDAPESSRDESSD